ncbi:MAG: 3-deoxy-manno-octulosonate cytidylyltransferase [Oscillatoriophycideae cyanobacterium NC_groundwater_1537_Pr4_S-0.65um_50_18]|nr:3-deoxy-manno-octulosonate cytidylyltransferase [Oscillatoriophycideae cyanobacterium NC_groundwater_1537_Pr4_S-0.65um_50_18]
MKILAVIPARYNSQRFPGKPLALIGGRPMIQLVYEAAKRCPEFTQVIVATDNDAIADCVRQFGGDVEMTDSKHPTGTDRVAEVAQRYPEMEVVVNVQGDQPFVTPEMLSELVSPYSQHQSPEMTTLACQLDLTAGYADPNVVKVICAQNGRALYFSRSPIPYFRFPGKAPVYHHLGLYAFRKDFLSQYSQLTITPLEECEGLEQLRVLEHGFEIRVCHTDKPILEINTPEDLVQAKLLIHQGHP